MSAPIAIRTQRESGLRLRVGVMPLLAAVLAACAPQPEPRSVSDFMDDGFARDGVLTRCNQDRDAAASDVECANARRAAAAVALEAARAPGQESETKVVALRDGAPAFAVYADGTAPLARRSLEVAVEPPRNELVIAEPELDVPDLAVVPRPVRNDETR